MIKVEKAWLRFIRVVSVNLSINGRITKNTLEKGYIFLFETEMTVTTIIVGVYRQQIHEERSALNH